MHLGYYLMHLFYSIVFLRRVKIDAAAVNQFRKVCNMSLAPAAVKYQGNWAPSLQIASLLESHTVLLGVLYGLLIGDDYLKSDPKICFRLARLL